MLLVAVPLALVGVYFVFRSFAATGIPSTMSLVKTIAAKDIAGSHNLVTKSNGTSYRIVDYSSLIATSIDPTISKQVSRVCINYLSGKGKIRFQLNSAGHGSFAGEKVLGSAAGSLCVDTPGGSQTNSAVAIMNYVDGSEQAAVTSIELYKGYEYSFMHRASAKQDYVPGSLDVYGGSPKWDGVRSRNIREISSPTANVITTRVPATELNETARICYHYGYYKSGSFGELQTVTAGTTVLINVDYIYYDGTTKTVTPSSINMTTSSGNGCTGNLPYNGGSDKNPQYANVRIVGNYVPGNNFAIDTIYGHVTY